MDFQRAACLAASSNDNTPLLLRSAATCVVRNPTQNNSDDLTYCRGAFESLPFGLSVIDGTLSMRYANRLFFELLDLPERFAEPGTTLADVIRYNAERGEYGDGDIEQLVAERLALAGKFEAHRFERVRPDNTVLEIVGVPIAQGGFVTTYTDITEQRAVQTALADSEEKYRLIFESVNDAIVVADIESLQIIEVNTAACTLYGYSREALIKLRIIDLSAEPEVSRERLQRLKNNRQYSRISGRHRCSDGAPIDIELTMSRCVLAKRQILVAIVRDMTESVRIGKELATHRDNLQQLVDQQTSDLIKARDQSEAAYQAKSEFLANMSHELRTPLHSILSFSNLGRRNIEKGQYEKSARFLIRVQQSGDKLLKFINDLLDLSKLEAGKMHYQMQVHAFDSIVAATVEEMESLAQEKGVRLCLEACPFSTAIHCDSARIEQVVRNLLSNAIKFTPSGKNIYLEFRKTQLACGRRAEDQAQRAAFELCVRDEGEGIPVDELETVFDKFAQSSQTRNGSGGTGLGLSICHEIVIAHGGSIHAESSPGNGAVFIVALPVGGPVKHYG